MSDKKITIEFDADLVERHSLVKDRIGAIVGETTVDEKYREFFSKTAEYLLFVNSVLDLVLNGEYRTKSIDELKSINDNNFNYIREEFYDDSYANPEYAYNKLGFKAEYELSDMVESAYYFVKNQK